MMPLLIRRSLLAILVGSSAAASMAAVSTGRVGLVAEDTTQGTVTIDDDRIAMANGMLSGNPLWAVPLKELSATRERPIFSPSRRPQAARIAATPDMRPPKPVEPDRPQLSLIGTIAGGKDGFGIFLDRTADTVLRLKTGQEHKGWILREVRSRETVMEKDDKTATLALPARPPAIPLRHP